MIGLALTLVLLVFVVRLLQVQAVDASAYAAKADQNRYVGRTVAAVRGEITDRNGVELATSVDAYDITADPTVFTPDAATKPDAPEQAAALLAPILGQNTDTLTRKLKTPHTRYVMLAQRRTPQVWNQIKDLKSTLAAKAEAGSVSVLAGVLAVPTSKRV
jgi:cell division protein FtsI (penicillin-binding protein 3)